MEELRKEVRAAMGKELARSNSKFQPFCSLHEGYAVLLEELEETSEAVNECQSQAKHLWIDIKANETKYAMNTAEKLRAAAIDAACEAIQCAAMCDKFLVLSKTAAQPKPSKKAEKKQTAEEEALDKACKWVTKNISDKKWPCGPDGEHQSREKCLRCLKLYQDSTKRQEETP